MVSTHAPLVRQHNYKSLIRLCQCPRIRGLTEQTDGFLHPSASKNTNVSQIKRTAKREPFGIFRPFFVRAAELYGVVVVKHRHDHTDQYDANNHEL